MSEQGVDLTILSKRWLVIEQTLASVIDRMSRHAINTHAQHTCPVACVTLKYSEVWGNRPSSMIATPAT